MPSTVTTPITVRIDNEDLDVLRRSASQCGVTVSTAIRALAMGAAAVERQQEVEAPAHGDR